MNTTRREFLKLLGGTLAAAGITYSAARALFPESPEPQQKTLQEALAELTEREDHEGVMRLLGAAYNESGALLAASPGILFCTALGLSVPKLINAARKLREDPGVRPLLRKLRQTLADPKRIGQQPVVCLAAEYEAARWLKKDPAEMFAKTYGREEGPQLLAEYRRVTGVA